MGYSWTFHLTLIKIADLSWRCLRFFISSLWRYPPNKTPCHHLAGVLFFLFSFLLCLYTCILFIFEILLTLFSFLWICSNLPLSSTYRLPPSPCPGTAYGFHSFWYNKQVIHFKTMNSFFLNISFPRTRRRLVCVSHFLIFVFTHIYFCSFVT